MVTIMRQVNALETRSGVAVFIHTAVLHRRGGGGGGREEEGRGE